MKEILIKWICGKHEANLNTKKDDKAVHDKYIYSTVSNYNKSGLTRTFHSVEELQQLSSIL